jgi:hypothetical protein
MLLGRGKSGCVDENRLSEIYICLERKTLRGIMYGDGDGELVRCIRRPVEGVVSRTSRIGRKRNSGL